MFDRPSQRTCAAMERTTFTRGCEGKPPRGFFFNIYSKVILTYTRASRPILPTKSKNTGDVFTDSFV